ARPGTPTPSKTLFQGLSWVPEAWRVAGFRKPGQGRFRKPPWAPPGAPSLSFGRETENRDTGAAGRPKNKTPARRSVGCLKTESENTTARVSHSLVIPDAAKRRSGIQTSR